MSKTYTGQDIFEAAMNAMDVYRSNGYEIDPSVKSKDENGVLIALKKGTATYSIFSYKTESEIKLYATHKDLSISDKPNHLMTMNFSKVGDNQYRVTEFISE